MNTGMWVFVLLECAVLAAVAAINALGPENDGSWGGDMAGFVQCFIWEWGSVACILGFAVSAAVHFL